MKPQTIALIAAAGAGVYLFAKSRPRPATAAATQQKRIPFTPNGRTMPSMTYANGQTMAELLARSVNLAFGVLGPVPKSADVSIGGAEARAATRAAESPGYYGWSGPTATMVDPGVLALYGGNGDPYSGGLADSVLAGPVYDVTKDLREYAWAEDWAGL